MSLTPFHGDDVSPSAPDQALFHVIPVPLEETVSYAGGTAGGPQAILEASCQLELFDGKSVPAQYGIHTTLPLDCTRPILQTLAELEERVSRTAACGAVPVVLGGEHSLTAACVRGISRHHHNFGIVQFDAHADLRDSYHGSKESHASVMRRIHEEDIPIYQIGTRSYSLEEHDFRRENNIPFVDAEEVWRKGAGSIRLPVDFPENIYITFDVDCFDAAVMPATGTPVPGGLHWYQVIEILENLLQSRLCLGFDLVELAPLPSMHGATFTVAQLAYNMMGYLVRSPKAKKHYTTLSCP
ncbi:MAG: agmatinase [Desulfopila sp.]|jgi:agmatinase|nr:agmatinase [Desulfopila sp.]